MNVEHNENLPLDSENLKKLQGLISSICALKEAELFLEPVNYE